MASSSTSAPNLLVIPYPAQGHMLPLLDLTHHLALRGRLSITIMVTPKNLPILTPLLASNPSIQTLVLPFPSHPKLPLGVEHVKDVGNHGNVPIMAALSKLHQPIMDWIKAHPASSTPRAIISDFFLGWTNNLAQQLNIPRIAFFSSGSFLVSVHSYLWLNLEDRRRLLQLQPVVEFPDLPRSPSFVQAHLPAMFRYYKESDPDSIIVKDGMVANFSSWGCIFNSFDALEGEYFHHLRSKFFSNGHLYGVGPLSLIGREARDLVLGPGLDTQHEALRWLDDCPDGSVLYVCFGSQKFLTSAQTEALGSGLERSFSRFIWVVRAPNAEEGRYDYDGLDERVKGRGLIIKGWAPQVEILGHKAVGGFLSHCGWNSVLESIVAGVMILAWPMEADQFINAKLMVDDMGVAVKACEGPETVPDPDELARVIRASLSSGEVPQRKMAKELKEKAHHAVAEGGSSYRDLEELVTELSQL